jgi:hypothetical protein
MGTRKIKVFYNEFTNPQVQINAAEFGKKTIRWKQGAGSANWEFHDIFYDTSSTGALSNKDVKKKTITVDNDKDITGDHEYTIQIKDSGGVLHDSSVKLSPPTGDKPVIRN